MAPSKSEPDAFAVPRNVAAVMRRFARPWWVAGGWAIDLFLGRVTREHEDIEIAILREDQAVLRRHLAGWDFQKVLRRGDIHTREAWSDGEWLELPVHEIHATRKSGDVRELEILLNEADGGRWRFRRDLRITKPLEELGLASEGIRILSPDVVLLYKAKSPRPRDEEDFRIVREALAADRAGWLRRSLGIAHPGHPWIERL